MFLEPTTLSHYATDSKPSLPLDEMYKECSYYLMYRQSVHSALFYFHSKV